MTDITTKYMGLTLNSPLIAGASELTADMDSLKKIEEAGAGAVVLKSLFEEQIDLEASEMETAIHQGDNRYAEMVTVLPEVKHAGPEEHLMWVKKAVEALSLPVIGSLNAVHGEVLLEYAEKMEAAGVSGLELNLYREPAAMEKGMSFPAQIEVVKRIKKRVSLPVSVKLSPYYEDPAETARSFSQAGADGLVIFNRLFEPEIDIEKEIHTAPFLLSHPGDYRQSLRFLGILSGECSASLAGATGIFRGEDVVKMILAGADAVQLVSVLYKKGIAEIGTINRALQSWMARKAYESLDEVRGKLSQKKVSEKWVYRRSQYVKKLMQGKPDLTITP